MARPLTLLVVFGHPEDETIKTGGVMARYAAEGVRVVCVTCTRGEVGEIVAPDLASSKNLASLGEIRHAELTRALEHLGPIECMWLGYRDSGLQGWEANDDPRSFWRANPDEAAGRLVRIVRECRADVIVSGDRWGDHGHPDHIRAALIAKIAYDRAGEPAAYAEQLSGPDALEAWAPSKLYEAIVPLDRREKVFRLIHERGLRGAAPTFLRRALRWRPGQERTRGRMVARRGAITTRVDVSEWLEAKRAALLEHRSQIAPDNPYLSLTAAERSIIDPTEDFRLRASRVPFVAPEVDLFSGLRHE